jgi:hypothetical protein
MLFDQGDTAKRRNLADVAFSVSQVHWLVMIFKMSILLRPKSQKREQAAPKTNVLMRALICPFLELHLTSHPTSGVQVLQKAWNLLSDGVKASLQRAESNLNALKTVDLGPKRPFSVGECALWARLTGP